MMWEFVKESLRVMMLSVMVVLVVLQVFAGALNIWFALPPSVTVVHSALASALFIATFVLWHGYCSVHQRFNVEQIEELRAMHPDALVIVHPECDREVVEASDESGSTEMIRKFVADAPPGSIIGVGTEIHLVKRLDAQYPDKDVICLDAGLCPCSTMYMIHPAYLAELLERMLEDEVVNRVVVPKQIADDAILALDRMLAIVA